LSYKLNAKQVDNIFKLSCEERYDYFLNKLADWQELWILVNEDKQFLKIFSEEDALEYVPVWPHPDFAVAYVGDSGEPLTPKRILLSDFFDRWVSGLQRDELEVGVFPSLDKTVWMTAPSELQEDLEDLLSQ